MAFSCGRFSFAGDRPLVMGIVNITVDSFSGDGVGDSVESALRRARRQLDAGADLLDLGAESSRPGALPVAENEEVARLLPVIRELAGCGVPLSVDTCKPSVMRAVLDAGADMINDIRGFRGNEAIEAVRGSECAVCVMHMQGEPRTMQSDPQYADVVTEVEDFLLERVRALRAAGVDGERIVLDPGFGFGKRLPHNIALFKALSRFASLGHPLLVGVSRKSMLGEISGRPVEQRLAASVAAALLAARSGARILRVHDVAETVDALAILERLGDSN
jgi:dihydropteroate synthase